MARLTLLLVFIRHVIVGPPAWPWQLGSRCTGSVLGCARLGACLPMLFAWRRQALLSAGAHAMSPAASAAASAKVATVWWPPVPAEIVQPTGAAAAELMPAAAPATGASPTSSKEGLGFTAETLRLLRQLSPTRSPKGSPRAKGAAKGSPRVAGPGSGGESAVAAEELRHPAPIVSLQWSPGVLQTGAGARLHVDSFLPGAGYIMSL